MNVGSCICLMSCCNISICMRERIAPNKSPTGSHR